MATGGNESGPTLYASFPKSAPDLLRMTQMEGICRNGRTGSLCLGPGITLTVDDSEEDSENDVGSQPCSPNLDLERRQQSSSIGRSQSMRTVRRPQPYDPTDPGSRFRQRISSIPTEKAVTPQSTSVARTSSNYSLPLPGEEVHYQRLRNFSVTDKGVINRGDSFRSKSRSALNIASNKRNSEQVAKPDEETTRNSSQIFVTSSLTITPGPVCDRKIVPPVIVTETMKHRVIIIGSPDVGKSCLTTQFTTSEYINAYDTSLAEDNEKSVTIVLNEQESELVFIEHSFIENTPIGQLLAPDVDACIVVYSVTNKASFQCAKAFLEQLRMTENTDRKAIIIVGNKTDLARLRTVTPEAGRTLAKTLDCKFIETSAGINHHVDELLVGILTQIRLKKHQEESLQKKRESVTLGKLRNLPSDGTGGNRAKDFLKRIFKKNTSKSKSCHNLNVL